MTTENEYMTAEQERTENPVVALFKEAKTANEERRREIALQLGCEVRSSRLEQFVSLLKTVELTGTINVTGWQRHSVKALLELCRDSNSHTTLRYDDRFLSPVTLPRSEPLLEKFVDAVMTGEWF